jgi:DNA-binding IclR family transcriptional regulator
MLSSVANALRVLEFLVQRGEVGVSDIGRHVGVTVGTAHRLVATLVEAGFAEQNPDNRRYQPSSRLIALARTMRAHVSVQAYLHESLNELMLVVRETVNLGVLYDDQVLYLDKVISDQPFGIEARIGTKLPFFVTALGKVLVGNLDDTEREELIARVRAAHRGDKRLPKLPALRKELMIVRERGWAEDRGEYLPDVCCVAAPIVGSSGKVIAAISTSVPRSRFGPSRDGLVEKVQAAAATASVTLSEMGVEQIPMRNETLNGRQPTSPASDAWL